MVCSGSGPPSSWSYQGRRGHSDLHSRRTFPPSHWWRNSSWTHRIGSSGWVPCWEELWSGWVPISFSLSPIDSCWWFSSLRFFCSGMTDPSSSPCEGVSGWWIVAVVLCFYGWVDRLFVGDVPLIVGWQSNLVLVVCLRLSWAWVVVWDFIFVWWPALVVCCWIGCFWIRFWRLGCRVRTCLRWA